VAMLALPLQPTVTVVVRAPAVAYIQLGWEREDWWV
jgi:hypothetical protein